MFGITPTRPLFIVKHGNLSKTIGPIFILVQSLLSFISILFIVKHKNVIGTHTGAKCGPEINMYITLIVENVIFGSFGWASYYEYAKYIY